jgi:cysteine synthase A
MEIINKIDNLIGNTPLFRLNWFCREYGVNLLAKLEFYNPGGSVKDRLALAMITDAEKTGKIHPGITIVEPTSGNTGVGLAMICAARKYRLIVTMPDNSSIERQKIIKGYGSEVILTPAAEGMKGSIKRAEELADFCFDSYIPFQFKNKANPQMHYETTGPEIWEATQGKVDIFVAGVGTGGTITGVGRFLKEKKSNIKIIAVEPKGSPVLSGGQPGKHKISGIGAGFIPEVLDTTIIDEIVQVTDDDAFYHARLLAKKEGILAGISSGAILYAALQLSSRPENKNKNIVFIVCDTGERYLSTSLF